MSLKITKDRSNIDNLELEETVEEFVENINKGIKSINSLSTSANSATDTLYEWDATYKAYNESLRNTVIECIKDYNSWVE